MPALLIAFALLALTSSCSVGRDNGHDDAGAASRPADDKVSTTQTQPVETRERRQRGEGQRPLVWVAVEDGNALALVDLARGKVVARYGAPGGPHNVTVATDGTAAATLYGSDRIVVVGPRARPRFVKLGGTPHDVKAVGERLLIANEAGRRIDFLVGGRHVGSLALKAEPHDLAITPSGARAWVTLNGSDELAVVDVKRRALVRYLATGSRPHDVLFAPDGRAWVTDWNGPVHIFDRRGRLRGTVELGQESHHLAFAPNGREAWITDHAARRVFVVDAQRLRIITALSVPGAPHHVAITPDGALAAVADHERGDVLVYDVDRRTRIGVIDVGNGPHGVWAAPGESG
jgi:DNA-binding beta-propeller fold protein YncE